MHPPQIVVIGASAGGVGALLELVATLPPNFPAVVGVVLHVGGQPSILPELLSQRGPLPAVHPRHGDVPRPGTIYVAPPNQHLLLTPGAIRLSRGPRENHVRPAIDPLFRTAALHWRERCIGVVLTGEMDDGTAGLAAVKQCGGVAMVQDPAEASSPSMPSSALASVDVDHCAPVAGLGALLGRLVPDHSPPPAGEPPQALQQEQALFEGVASMNELSAIAQPSNLTCPDCGGTLSELKEMRPLRYRCHTGHAFTVLTLEAAQADEADHALQSGMRSLKEREMLLRRVAAVADALGQAAQADAGRREAERLRAQRQTLHLMVQDSAAHNQRPTDDHPG